jgi:hypothetical protein
MLTMPAAAVLSLFLVGMVLWLINGYVPIPAGRLKTVVNVVLGLIVVGIALWLVNTYIPMAGVIKGILNIVVVIATCVGVLQAFGLWGSVQNMWRKIRHHRWSHPEHDQPPATERSTIEKPATAEKPVVETRAVEKATTEKAPTVRVETARPVERGTPEKASNDKPAGEKADVSDPSVTVIVK